jgi:hypothetical protein
MTAAMIADTARIDIARNTPLRRHAGGAAAAILPSFLNQ